MNIANTISLTRIFLIPIIIILMLIYPYGSLYNGWNETLNINYDSITYYKLPKSYLIAGILFFIATITDFLDGYIARKYNKVTTLGKFLDSIADKLLINSVLIIMAIISIIPVWMIIILVARDFLVDGLRQVLAAKKIILAANKIGKSKFFLEAIGILILFFVSFRNFEDDDINKSNTIFGEYGIINQLVLIPMYLGTILSIVSGIYYFKIHWENLIPKF